MLKNAFLMLLSLAIAIGGGGASVWYALKIQDGVGAIRIGQWTAFPDIGTLAADPYSKARVAREGVLALGRAEGLSFVAENDAAGDQLKRECTYRIEADFRPPASGHSMPPINRSASLKPANRDLQHFSPIQVLRQADNSVIISVGHHPMPGNWLLTDGSGRMYFVLTFYDTPIASSTGLSDVSLPRIVKAGCDA